MVVRYWQKNYGGACSVIRQSITVKREAREYWRVAQGISLFELGGCRLLLPMWLKRSDTKLGGNEL